MFLLNIEGNLVNVKYDQGTMWGRVCTVCAIDCFIRNQSSKVQNLRSGKNVPQIYLCLKCPTRSTIKSTKPTEEKNCTKYKTYMWHSRPTGSPDSLHGAWTIQKIIKAKYFLSSKYESAINVKHWQRQNVTSYHFFRYLNFFVFHQKKTLSFYEYETFTLYKPQILWEFAIELNLKNT